MSAPTRRSVLLAAGATASGCVHAPDPPPEGISTYSESVQVSCADISGRRYFAVRLCQYPEAGVAWVWAAVLMDRRFVQYVDNRTPWSGEPVRDEAPASYTAQNDAAFVAFERTGPRVGMQSGALACTFRDRLTRARVTVEAQFTPSRAHSALLPGRAEAFGTVAARLRIDETRYELDGLGQWHEQPQTDPRFVVPFTYGSLWSGAAAATLIETSQGSGGYVIAESGVRQVSAVSFTPPGDRRSIALRFTNSSVASMSVAERHSYTMQVYGRVWRGSFVTAELNGLPTVGLVNDFAR